MSNKSTKELDLVTVHDLFKGRAKTVPKIKVFSSDETHGPAKTIAVVNQKGGVGKTTTTISLGASLAELGRRVLLVDFDPQGSLSIGLGVITDELESSIYNLLMDRNASVDDVLLKTTVPGMDLIPSDIMLSGAEIGLVNEVAREQSLKRILAPLALEYDVILIDCQPSLGLLTVNALTAADLILVPLQCEYFALRGFKLLKEITSKIQERLNPDLAIIGIVATMFEKTAHSKEVLARIYEAFPNLLFDTVISKTVRFNETTAAGEPITSYASSSPGATAYRRLAREVIARGGSR
ncbi:MAG: ParA family protein [Actinobacteria bacterium]|nr:ParA family protein [Actinomycetota bacterium]